MGFEPSGLTLQAGRAARIAFTRTTDETCGALGYPHEPTTCANPEHVQLLRDGASMLELAMTMVPDGLRYIAATTPDATNAVRSKRMRKLSDMMSENWRRSQPS